MHHHLCIVYNIIIGFQFSPRDASLYRAVVVVILCPSVCPWQVGVLPKWLNGLSWF